MKNLLIKIMAACILLWTQTGIECANARPWGDIFRNSGNNSSNFRTTNFSRSKYEIHKKMKRFQPRHRSKKIFTHPHKNVSHYESRKVPMNERKGYTLWMPVKN